MTGPGGEEPVAQASSKSKRKAEPRCSDGGRQAEPQPASKRAREGSEQPCASTGHQGGLGESRSAGSPLAAPLGTHKERPAPASPAPCAPACRRP